MSSFRAIVNVDEDGDITCFCPYENYLKGNCRCRNEGIDCPEGIMDITVMPNSRPSDLEVIEIRKATRKISESKREFKKATDRIKQGVSQLEKVTKSNRWRI